jgi:hypothetical protein
MRGIDLLVLILLAGCATPKSGSPEAQAFMLQRHENQLADQVKTIVTEAPDWYLAPPKDDLNLYASGTSTSGDLQFATDKAVLMAKANIVSRLESKISMEMKQFISESGRESDAVATKHAEQVIKEVMSEASLKGYIVLKSELKAQGTAYRVFVLVQYPIGDANFALKSKIRQDADLAVKVGAAKSFKELEAEIQASRDIKASAQLDNR